MDAYETLGLSRRLDLTEEELRQAYDRMAGDQHPDAGGDESAFALLREARETLRSPGRRLRHWLELGDMKWDAGGELPAALLELFGEVGDLVMQVDRILMKLAAAQTALGRSLLERESMDLLEAVEQTRTKLGAMRDRAVKRFAGYDQAGPAECAHEAAETARTLLFLEKWDAQLRERWADLAG